MNDMKILHALPERMHLKVPAVRNVRTARRFEDRGRDIEGIHWVRANSRCAGLVVRFDGSMHSADGIMDLLRQIASEGRA